MGPRIEVIAEKKLIGRSMTMSLAVNRTGELWRDFMSRKRGIKNIIGNVLYSIQVYDPSYFTLFDPRTTFLKWAAVETAAVNEVPDEMEAFTLPCGTYAVFIYKGPASAGSHFFQYIFSTWLPSSGYMLDDRPHFEILGEKYKNEDPESEEEIWIPVRPKMKG
jgi:AraC family transcriptional regulator